MFFNEGWESLLNVLKSDKNKVGVRLVLNFRGGRLVKEKLGYWFLELVV